MAFWISIALMEEFGDNPEKLTISSSIISMLPNTDILEIYI